MNRTHRPDFRKILLITAIAGRHGGLPLQSRPGFRQLLLVVVLGLTLLSCAPAPNDGADPEVTRRGAAEVTAELVEIRGEFIDRSDYDYAFVMKYRILETHRGSFEGDTIYVAHYNPQKPRDRVIDARVDDVGGTLQRFRAGDIHRMALESPLDDYYMGGVVNRYFEEYNGPIHWAVWTNLVTQ